MVSESSLARGLSRRNFSPSAKRNESREVCSWPRMLTKQLYVQVDWEGLDYVTLWESMGFAVCTVIADKSLHGLSKHFVWGYNMWRASAIGINQSAGLDCVSVPNPSRYLWLRELLDGALITPEDWKMGENSHHYHHHYFMELHDYFDYSLKQ